MDRTAIFLKMFSVHTSSILQGVKEHPPQYPPELNLNLLVRSLEERSCWQRTSLPNVEQVLNPE
jgi:hypothetical protein